jgi:hypothetical protein
LRQRAIHRLPRGLAVREIIARGQWLIARLNGHLLLASRESRKRGHDAE